MLDESNFCITAGRCWKLTTLILIGEDVGMNQHQAIRPWFWLRGDTGAGRALAGARHAAGLTQAELASRLGVDRTTVVSLEAGRNAAVSRLIRAFNGMGYDLIAVPRTARVTVDLRAQLGTDPEGDSPKDTPQ